MLYVNSNGIKIYYEIHGEGEPFLFIQGTADCGAWGFQLPAFSTKYKVIIFDNRGIGRTDSPEPPYSIEEMAADSFGLLDTLGIEKAKILGYSMGGCVAIEMASKMPERVDCLILAGAYNRMSAIARFRTRAIMELLQEKNLGLEKQLRNFMPWWLSERFLENEENTRAFVDNFMHNPISSHGFIGMCAAMIEYKGVDLASIKCPTLVVTGSEDLAVSARLGKELAEGIPGAKFSVLEGAAHSMIFEDAERFNQTVLDFLERNGR